MTWPGLPVLVRLAGRPVILVGEGEAADAKRRVLERAGAVVVADAPDARLAVVAVEDEAQAMTAVARLRARGLLVNAVDRPALCDFTLPAVVDRAPVLVTVATGGVSAGLAAAVRQRLEALLPDGLGRLAEKLYASRAELRRRYPDAGERRRAIGAALQGELDPLDAGAAERVKEVLLPPLPGREGLGLGVGVGASAPIAIETLGSLRSQPTPDPSLSGRGGIIRLTSPDPDDLTLRQARALALADRVLHAADVPPAILARARADAPRIALSARPAHIAAGDVWVEVA